MSECLNALVGLARVYWCNGVNVLVGGNRDLRIRGFMDLRKMLDGESVSGTTILEMAKR